MIESKGRFRAGPLVGVGRHVLPRLLATYGRPGADDHLRQWGVLPRGGRGLIEEIDRSGLTGRGGAGFPTATKWKAVASARRPTVVANGTEGEPVSQKDKVLMTHSPHLVIDGVVLAAESIGADHATICIDEKAHAASTALERALAERGGGLDGQPAIHIVRVPSGYVSGEETAVVRWIDQGVALPSFGSRPYERGVGGRPTLVQNVETLAHVALIARFGASWFRGLGTDESPGSALVTVSGDVSRPTVAEVSLGSTLDDVVRLGEPLGQPEAVLVGGFFGTWIRRDAVPVQLDRLALAEQRASLGCGALLVVGDDSCGLKTAAVIARWMAGQSGGQCGPCQKGLPSIADALDRLVAGDSTGRWMAQLERWLWMVDGRGACKHPDGTVRMVRSAMDVFGPEIERHARAGPCESGPAPLPLSRIGTRRR